MEARGDSDQSHRENHEPPERERQEYSEPETETAVHSTPWGAERKGQKVLEMEEMVFSSHWGWDDVMQYMTDSCEVFLLAINQHVNQISGWFPFIYIFMSPCNC